MHPHTCKVQQRDPIDVFHRKQAGRGQLWEYLWDDDLKGDTSIAGKLQEDCNPLGLIRSRSRPTDLAKEREVHRMLLKCGLDGRGAVGLPQEVKL